MQHTIEVSWNCANINFSIKMKNSITIGRLLSIVMELNGIIVECGIT